MAQKQAHTMGEAHSAGLAGRSAPLSPLRRVNADHLVYHRSDRYRQDTPAHWVQARRHAASALSSSTPALPVTSRVSRKLRAHGLIFLPRVGRSLTGRGTRLAPRVCLSAQGRMISQPEPPGGSMKPDRRRSGDTCRTHMSEIASI